MFASQANAQKLSDELFPTSYNKKYLEHLIKTKVDSVRAVHDLPALANDSILYEAAQYHADYLKRTDRFSHYEEDIPKMRTPQLRIDSFGAINVSAGENLVKSSIQKPVRTKEGATILCKTYNQIAWHLVDLWVHSPGHFANIITPAWDITGVAINVDSVTGEVLAAQKFGDVLFAYQFDENRAFFNYSEYITTEPITSFSQVDSQLLVIKHEYGTLPLTPTLKTAQAATIIELREYKIDTYTKGKKVGIETWSTEMLFKFLAKHRKNGLAFEFVPFEPYDCGNPAYYTEPSRRNGQRIYSGEVSEPKYRKELLRGFKRNKYSWFWRANRKADRNLFKLNMAKQPENSVYYERNILFYHKKQLLRVMHLTGYCGEGTIDFDLEHPSKGFLKYKPEADVYIPPYIDKRIVFEIPFEQGKVDLSEGSSGAILDSIRHRFTQVDSLKIDAFSSLEGDSLINVELQLARAESIKQLVSDTAQKIEFQVELNENWQKLEAQIADSIGVEHWSEWTREQIRAELNSKPDSFEFILKEQRKAIVQVDGIIHQNLQDSLDFLSEKYQAILGLEDEQATAALDDTLAKYYALYAQLVNFDRSKFLPLPEDLKGFNHLDQTRYWIALLHSVTDWDDQNQVAEIASQLGAWKRSSKESSVYYNDLLFQLKLDPDFHRVDYQVLYKEAMKKSFSSMYLPGISESRKDSLLLLLNVRSAEQILEKGTPGFEENIDFVFNYYERYKSLIASEKDAVKLANFFLKYDNQPYAHSQLEPWADSTNLEALMLFAKINYHHIEEYPSSGYFEWLIDLQKYLSGQQWCSLFIGECNIPFQVFDYEPLRNEYCAKCDDYKNAVELRYEELQKAKD
jgi:uncharacterized protein YkwD